MIKFRMEAPEGPRLGFGITQENIDRLVAGQPIVINLAEMGLEGTAMIFYGATEADIYQQVKPHIGPETLVEIDPRLGIPND